MEVILHNVVVVSMNKKSAIAIGEQIAKMLSLACIDADNLIEERLLRSIDYPLDLADDIMRNSETNLIKSLSNTDRCVICINDDTFLSNKNFEIFKKSLKILVNIEKNNKLEENLQKLLEKYCDVIINEKDIDFDKLITLLRG